MTTWRSATPPPPLTLRAKQGWRAVWRFAVLALGLVPILPALGVARALERLPGATAGRYAPHVVRGYCRFLLWVIGLRTDLRGADLTGRGALVANHASWLDIFVLNALTPALFVAKAEVAGWPGIGPLVRLVGTVFIRRDRRDAPRQTQALAEEFRRGQFLVFFPEGTSTDGTLVLPFKTTLFQAFLAPNLPQELQVQPVSLRYHAPDGTDARFYGWWGDMGFARHFVQVLGQKPQGHVTVTVHPPVPCLPGTHRKTLAAACEAAVRAGFAAG